MDTEETATEQPTEQRLAELHEMLCSDWNNPNGSWLAKLEEYERIQKKLDLRGMKYEMWVKDRFLAGGSSGAARGLERLGHLALQRLLP